MRHSLRKSTQTFAAALLFCLPLSLLHAQDGRYVTNATLELSVGDGTEVWLNGHKIAAADPVLKKEDGHVQVDLKGQLCYFQAQNVLAFQLSQSFEKKSILGENDYLGINYVLTLSFSDNKTQIYTSNEANKHQRLLIEEKTDPDPKGWTSEEFNDSQWELAVGAKAVAEDPIPDPATHRPLNSLGGIRSGGDGVFATRPGTRSDFRRKFALDIVPGPGCPQPPKPKPTATFTFTRVPPRPTATPTWTFTPRPRPTNTFTPTFTFTPTRIPKARPIPTATFTPTPLPPPPPPRVTHVRRIPPTPTNTRFIPPTPTPKPIRRRPWPTAIPTSTPRPIPTPVSEPAASMPMPETIVFVNPPVNIYIEFADGPGQYKLEVVDAGQNHIRTLFDRHVTGDENQWVEWDGKNEQGTLMSYGQYFAIFTKDGKALRPPTALTWIRETP